MKNDVRRRETPRSFASQFTLSFTVHFTLLFTIAHLMKFWSDSLLGRSLTFPRPSVLPLRTSAVKMLLLVSSDCHATFGA